MQPSQVQIEMLQKPVEGLQKILVQRIPLIKDDLRKAPIQHQLEGQGQEITVQDLMINSTIILVNDSSPFQKRYLA